MFDVLYVRMYNVNKSSIKSVHHIKWLGLTLQTVINLLDSCMDYVYIHFINFLKWDKNLAGFIKNIFKEQKLYWFGATWVKGYFKQKWIFFQDFLKNVFLPISKYIFCVLQRKESHTGLGWHPFKGEACDTGTTNNTEQNCKITLGSKKTTLGQEINWDIQFGVTRSAEMTRIHL